MCGRPKVVVSKDRAQGAVTTTVIQQGVVHPELDRSLGSGEILAMRRGAENTGRRFGFELGYRHFFDARQKRQGRSQAMLNLRIVTGLGRNRTFVKSSSQRALGVVDSVDAVTHLIRTERSIFIVEAIGCTIGGKNVKLHQVNVLANDVRGRANLEIIQLVVAGGQIRVPVFNAVTAIGAEKQRLRWTLT